MRPPDLTVPTPGCEPEEVGAWWDAGNAGDTGNARDTGNAGNARRPAVLLAHGAGADGASAFLEHVARGLAERGLSVLRFRYGYAERMAREGRRRPPDRAPRLEAVHAAALVALTERCPGQPVVLMGKSMGARMGSHLAAQGAPSTEACVRALVHLGFPLHPPRKPSRQRAEHFRTLPLPALFLSGTRDPLCTPELLEEALAHHGGPPTLQWIEDADHDFKVPKRTGRSHAEVLDDLVARADAWIRATLEG